MSKYEGLRQQNGGTYQLRLGVPEDMKWAFDGKREFKRTLGTKNRIDAEIKYHRLVAAFLEKVRAAREGKRVAPDPLTEEDVCRIVNNYKRRTLDEIKAWFRNLGIGDDAMAQAGFDTSDRDRQAVIDELEDDKTILDRPNNPDTLPMVGQAAEQIIEREGIYRAFRHVRSASWSSPWACRVSRRAKSRGCP